MFPDFNERIGPSEKSPVFGEEDRIEKPSQLAYSLGVSVQNLSALFRTIQELPAGVKVVFDDENRLVPSAEAAVLTTKKAAEIFNTVNLGYVVSPESETKVREGVNTALEYAKWMAQAIVRTFRGDKLEDLTRGFEKITKSTTAVFDLVSKAIDERVEDAVPLNMRELEDLSAQMATLFENVQASSSGFNQLIQTYQNSNQQNRAREINALQSSFEELTRFVTQKIDESQKEIRERTATIEANIEYLKANIPKVRQTLDALREQNLDRLNHDVTLQLLFQSLGRENDKIQELAKKFKIDQEPSISCNESRSLRKDVETLLVNLEQFARSASTQSSFRPVISTEETLPPTPPKTPPKTPPPPPPPPPQILTTPATGSRAASSIKATPSNDTPFAGITDSSKRRTFKKVVQKAKPVGSGELVKEVDKYLKKRREGISDSEDSSSSDVDGDWK